MLFTEIFFVFHRPATIREILSGDAEWTQAFGHVEAYGYTVDETWFFYDPGRYATALLITHLHEEVTDLIAQRIERADEIIRYSGEPLKFMAPIHGPMNCVTQCAALVGLRAYTPRGFRRILLRNNAEVIHAAERRPGSQERPAT